MCFAFDLLNNYKFTVNWSKLGNSSQKYHWSDAPSEPDKIPLVKFLNVLPVVPCFLFMAINFTVFFLVCRLTFAYPESLSCVHTYVSLPSHKTRSSQDSVRRAKWDLDSDSLILSLLKWVVILKKTLSFMLTSNTNSAQT